VVELRESAFCSPTNETVAPGIAAPFVSVTIPLTEPVIDCATAVILSSIVANKNSKSLDKLREELNPRCESNQDVLLVNFMMHLLIKCGVRSRHR
jgi:hypothetical protein